MKIGTVIAATDANPTYIDFVPSFIRAWNAVLPDADVQVVLVAPKSQGLPDALKPYEAHIRFSEPIPNVSTAFHAQTIRLLAPAMVTRDEGVLISDIDMLPLSTAYFTCPLTSAPDDAFVIMRDGVCGPNQVCMCYCVARPATWRDIMGLTEVPPMKVMKAMQAMAEQAHLRDERVARIERQQIAEWYKEQSYDGTPGGRGWFTDQEILWKKVHHWEMPVLAVMPSGPPARLVVRLKDSDTGFGRLDRANPDAVRQVADSTSTWWCQFEQRGFVDYHAMRPYKEHAALNDAIVHCLEARRRVESQPGFVQKDTWPTACNRPGQNRVARSAPLSTAWRLLAFLLVSIAVALVTFKRMQRHH